MGSRFDHVVTVEDGVRQGGMGSAVLEWLDDHGYHPRLTRLGLPDLFVEHGKVDELRQAVGLDAAHICTAILEGGTTEVKA